MRNGCEKDAFVGNGSINWFRCLYTRVSEFRPLHTRALEVQVPSHYSSMVQAPSHSIITQVTNNSIKIHWLH